jgi:hypothetical protein
VPVIWQRAEQHTLRVIHADTCPWPDQEIAERYDDPVCPQGLPIFWTGCPDSEICRAGCGVIAS